MDTGTGKNFIKRIICTGLMVMMLFSAVSMSACTKEDQSENAKDSETTVRAADPMTEEEMEADDTDGCIEDSEDLLY